MVLNFVKTVNVTKTSFVRKFWGAKATDSDATDFIPIDRRIKTLP